ncbi:TPA: DoxX family protein [Staphylococcus aureus]|nr:DoxX family protein [Staphylococcus aureus]HDF3553789.1 DoxX family protein [Staphylococcus aureus]HDT6951293.1 DoxX family protein [Staphylococcus aureus]HDT6956910.1 DoxX family protein [Staphylococcus aureus]HDT6961941.1 DoxX family protein [Staphylococcus aureus]
MLLRHVINTYVGSEIFKSSLPKVQNSDEMAQQFEQGFGLSRRSMRLAGAFEMIGSLLLFTSIFGKLGKKLVVVGTIMINIVMGTAIYNHYKAGHGYKGAQAASKFFFLNVLSLLEVLSLIRNK